MGAIGIECPAGNAFSLRAAKASTAVVADALDTKPQKSRLIGSVVEVEIAMRRKSGAIDAAASIKATCDCDSGGLRA
jgi:hypothetical protein